MGDSDAVVKADSAGKATNQLSILGRGRRVTFQVSRREVHTAGAADSQGIVGYRVNHNLDVHVGALGMQRL